MGRIYKWLAMALGAIGAVLGVMLNVTQRKQAAAEERADRQTRRADSAEASIDNRNRADAASREAKEKGDEEVRQVRDRARAGRRDHFESGMSDDD